jgi:hypothetical protein
MTYSEKLKDPRWQEKRLRIMDRDRFTCQKCQDATKTLNVHHRYYTKGAMPWEYSDDALVTLCENCHKSIETRIAYMNRAIHGDENRQHTFLRLLNAEMCDGPYSNPGFNALITAVDKFLSDYEQAVLGEDDGSEALAQLKMQSFEVVSCLLRGVNSAQTFITLHSFGQLDQSPDSISNGPGVDGKFWASFLERLNQRRPLTLHWVSVATLLSLDDGVIKLGFPESEWAAKESLMRDTTREFLEEVGESLLGRKVTLETVIDPSLATSDVWAQSDGVL